MLWHAPARVPHSNSNFTADRIAQPAPQRPSPPVFPWVSDIHSSTQPTPSATSSTLKPYLDTSEQQQALSKQQQHQLTPGRLSTTSQHWQTPLCFRCLEVSAAAMRPTSFRQARVFMQSWTGPCVCSTLGSLGASGTASGHMCGSFHRQRSSPRYAASCVPQSSMHDVFWGKVHIQTVCNTFDMWWLFTSAIILVFVCLSQGPVIKAPRHFPAFPNHPVRHATQSFRTPSACCCLLESRAA